MLRLGSKVFKYPQSSLLCQSSNELIFILHNARLNSSFQAPQTISDKEDLNHPSLNFQSLENIWQSITAVDESKELFVKKSAGIINALAELKRNEKLSESDYLKDERFIRVLKGLESEQIKRLDPIPAIRSLKSLEELGVSGESFCVKNLENGLTWLARTCSMKDLLMLLSFTIPRRKTDSQKLLFKEVKNSLERRWTEIKEGWMFVNLLHYSEQFSSKFISKLEDRIADLVEEFEDAELVKILTELGRKRRRNLALIRALTFYIVKFKENLDLKYLSDTIFALNQLSFKDQSLLERLSEKLPEKIKECENRAVIRSLLTSLGQLRYSNNEVLEKILDWYQERLDQMEVKDMTTIVLTLATLNFSINSQYDGLFKHISTELQLARLENLSNKDQVWLDFVWSLIVLQRHSHFHLESVLNPDFYNNVLYGGDKNPGSALKLLNINAAASKLDPTYRGPTINLGDDALLLDTRPAMSLAKAKFNQVVLEAFSSLYTPPRFLATDVNTLMGSSVDGVFVCDVKNSSVKPVPIPEDGKELEFMDSSGTDLPHGQVKVALVLASFNDCLLGGDLSGVTALNIKLMEAAGFNVFLVKFTDIEANANLVDRVTKLDAMLKDSLRIYK